MQNIYDFEDLAVLDLFGGTGSISFEFASRGANPIFTVEKNRKHFEYICKNSEDLGFTEVIKPLNTNVFTLISKLTQQFDIIFADPPFDLEESKNLPDLVFSTEILAEEGLFILEHSADKDFSQHPNFERLVKRGSVLFSFFSKKV